MKTDISIASITTKHRKNRRMNQWTVSHLTFAKTPGRKNGVRLTSAETHSCFLNSTLEDNELLRERLACAYTMKIFKQKNHNGKMKFENERKLFGHKQ